MSNFAKVRLWDHDVGVAKFDDQTRVVSFSYFPEFVGTHLELAPFKMPLSPSAVYTFPGKPNDGLHGLPGLLADSLPDDWGNRLIDAWLSRQGRSPESFNVVERLCYVGSRGMGTLEFQPERGPGHEGETIDVSALADLARRILDQRTDLAESFDADRRSQSMHSLLLVGTSAGGARAKAIVAWNQATSEVRSGQIKAGSGFTYWLLKFDGVRDGTREFGGSSGYGLIEYAYSQMARAAGIEMTECRLLEEGGRHHFMTKRFDRTDAGEKLHVQSLSALQHYDFQLAGAYSYEEAFLTIRRLGLPMATIEQQMRRTIFNVLSRNQDDHVKNVAFLMDRSGKWTLSPAFDVCYAFNPTGEWTSRHQMSINGKLDEFNLDDFRELASLVNMKRGRVEEIIEEVSSAVIRWPEFAHEANVAPSTIPRIQAAHRTLLRSPAG